MADKSTIELTGDTKSIDEAVDRAGDTFEEFGEEVKGIAEKVKSAWDESMGWIADKLRAGYEAITQYIGNLFDEMWSRIQAGTKKFIEAQAEFTRTEAMLKATGNAAGFTAQELEKMNKAMQGMSVHGQDAIRSAQQALLEYRNVRGDIFTEAIKGAMNLSAVTGESLTAAVREFGKALQDPVEGLQKLQESGVKFTQQELNAVNAMTKANDMIGVQYFLLKKLEAVFGGAAEAQAKTFSGQMQRLDNILDDIAQTLGSLLVPALTEKFIPAAQAVSRIVDYLVKQLMDSGSKIGEYWDKGVEIAIDAFHKLVDVLTIGFSYVQTAVENFADYWDTSWKRIKAESALVMVDIIDLLLDWAQKAVDSIPVIVNAFKDLWTKMVDMAEPAWQALKTGWKAFCDEFGKQLDNLWQNAEGFWDMLKNKALGGKGDWKFQPVADGFTQAMKDAAAKAKEGFDKIMANKVDVRGALPGVEEFLKDTQIGAMDAIEGIADAEDELDKKFQENLDKNRQRVQDFKDTIAGIIAGEGMPQKEPRGPFELPAGDKKKGDDDEKRGGGFEDLLALNRRIQGAAFATSPEEKAIKNQTEKFKEFASKNIEQGQQIIQNTSPRPRELAMAGFENEGAVTA